LHDNLTGRHSTENAPAVLSLRSRLATLRRTTEQRGSQPVPLSPTHAFNLSASSAACERNKEPIAAVLRGAFAAKTHVLEIGSGTGQHAVYLAAQLRWLTWHPTEREPHLEALRDRVRREGGANVATPELLDVRQAHWPLAEADALFTANTLHIMSWTEVVDLFDGVSRTLAGGGTMCIYGPFSYAGQFTSPSNRDFDAMLRERDPQSGLRDLGDVVKLAARAGLELVQDSDLPAFNRLLTFVKTSA